MPSVKGRARDVRLEPGDIVYVPNSPYTTLKRYFNIILNTFATTVAANEGIARGRNEPAWALPCRSAMISVNDLLTAPSGLSAVSGSWRAP